MSQATPSLQSNLKQWLRASAPSLFQIKQRLSSRRWPKKSIVIYTEKYRPMLPAEIWQQGPVVPKHRWLF